VAVAGAWDEVWLDGGWDCLVASCQHEATVVAVVAVVAVMPHIVVGLDMNVVAA